MRIVIPYSPGSVADVFGRIVAQNMAAQWNGSIVVESKSGANGSIAAEEVARAAPDGYTWLLVTTFFTASPALDAKLRWDPVRDFIPVGQICRAPNFFIVPTSLPVKNVAEYVALAKAKPGTLNYSHPGKGSTGHLGFELFKRLAGIDVTAVGYRGYPQMVPDIASGLITSTFLSANQALAQVQTGTIRIIGAINDGRSKYFPDVPTMAEQGFAEAQVTPWFGVVVPAGTPQPIVDRISKALEAALATPDVREKLDIAGCEPKSAPPGSSPTSSRPTSRCGRRWSRKPASPRIERRSGVNRRRFAAGAAGMFPWGGFQRIKADCPEPVPIPMPFAAIVQRIRSFSLSIGQLTFGSFLLLLAMIMMTSVASVVAIRHIDATFAELQRLQSVGDLAEEIDRRMNELRLAARDFVTDPEAQSDRVWEAASALSALLKKTRLELAPEQQEMIDGVAQRLANYRDGIERVTALIARRAELIAALPPLRERFEAAIAEVPGPGDRQKPVPGAEPDRRGAAGARSGRRRAGGAAHAGAADRRSRAARRGRCLCRCDHFDLGDRKPRSPSSTRKCWAPKAG